MIGLVIYLIILHLLWGVYAVKKNLQLAAASNDYTIFDHILTFIANSFFLPFAILVAIARR